MTTLGQKSSRRTNKITPEGLIGVQDILLEYILTHRWKDYDQFARVLSIILIRAGPRTGKQLIELVQSTVHPFFMHNHVTKTQFVKGLPVEALLTRSRETSTVPKRKDRTGIRKRHPIGQKLRMLILERDRFRCTLCGKSARETKLEVDHNVPVAKGGTDTLDNLRTLCFDCNRGKSDLSLRPPPT